MPDQAHFTLFLAAALILLFTPGPAVLFIVTRAVEQGRLAGLVSALGITLGTLVHVTAATLGLSALLLSSVALFSLIKYAGAAYLLVLGIRKIWRKESDEAAEGARPLPLRRLLVQGFWVNILNPKATLFIFAFLPQFVDVGRGNVGQQIALLGLCFAAMGLTSDSLYGLAAGSLSSRLRGRPQLLRAQRYVSGSVYIGLGVVAALAGGRQK
jgi:threonine/homoserine/homoserine lactone efflux protein